MKQVQFSETDDASVLRVVEVVRPKPDPNQMLVRVKSASVSFSDIVRRCGDTYPVPTPLPVVIGSEVAGFVEAVDENVKNLMAGDTVFGSTDLGGYSQRDHRSKKVRSSLLRRPIVAFTTTSLPDSPEQASKNSFQTSARTQDAGSIQQKRSLR